MKSVHSAIGNIVGFGRVLSVSLLLFAAFGCDHKEEQSKDSRSAEPLSTTQEQKADKVQTTSWSELLQKTEAITGRKIRTLGGGLEKSNDRQPRNVWADTYLRIHSKFDKRPAGEMEPAQLCDDAGTGPEMRNAFIRAVGEYKRANEELGEDEAKVAIARVHKEFCDTVSRKSTKRDLPFLLYVLTYCDTYAFGLGGQDLIRGIGFEIIGREGAEVIKRTILDKLAGASKFDNEEIMGLVLVALWQDYHGLASSRMLCDICASSGDQRAIPVLVACYKYKGVFVVTGIAEAIKTLDPNGELVNLYLGAVQEGISEWQRSSRSDAIPAWAQKARELGGELEMLEKAPTKIRPLH